MIRSVKLSTKFTNTTKQKQYKLFLNEYRNVVAKFIDILWEEKIITLLLSKKITQQINSTWLSARAVQCAGKQASSIVRGTQKKQKQRMYKLRQLQKENKDTIKLQRTIDKANISKPNISEINPILDSRFFKIDSNNPTIFDIWINLTSLGNKMKLVIPLKQTRIYNKWNTQGQIKNSIRLLSDKIELVFEIPDSLKSSGDTIGLDIGVTNTYYSSDKQHSKEDIHSWSLDKITKRLSQRKKGSKGFERTQQHRTNYINWSLNQLNLTNVKQVNIENIKKLRYKSKYSRLLSHWTYTDIFDKIRQYCEEQNVSVQIINPIYTSQRCSVCGWTQKKNRKGKSFSCLKCKFTCDSDWNAALNISFDLPEITWNDRQKHLNVQGFYWNSNGFDQECIVPDSPVKT